jgi:flagellar basal-body rod protein FlgG
MGINLSTIFRGLNDSSNILNRSGHNIANLNTYGYKATNSLTGSTNFSGSNFIYTGQNLDLGIEGDGFFKVKNQDGESFYSRKGDFSLDAEGKIVDSNGYKLDVNFKLDANQPFAINKDGSVYQNGEKKGEIRAYTFKGKQELTRHSGGYFLPVREEPVISNNAIINSGVRESSNTDIAEEQIAQIIGSRTYEANIKGLKVLDNILGIALDIKA